MHNTLPPSKLESFGSKIDQFSIIHLSSGLVFGSSRLENEEYNCIYFLEQTYSPCAPFPFLLFHIPEQCDISFQIRDHAYDIILSHQHSSVL